MRNAELINKVADAIEAHPDRYDQEVWTSDGRWKSLDVHTCGTAFCIAGWAVAVDHWETGAWGRVHSDETDQVARQLMGLTPREGHFLFGPEWLPNADMAELDEPHLRAKHVANALRDIADGASVYDVGHRPGDRVDEG